MGALRLATDRRRPAEQRALELWGGGAAAALLATVALGLSWQWAAVGFAAASLALALIARQLKWRAIAVAAAAGAGLGLAALLDPSIVSHALGGGGEAWFLLGAGLALAVAAFVGARMSPTTPARPRRCARSRRWRRWPARSCSCAGWRAAGAGSRWTA